MFLRPLDLLKELLSSSDVISVPEKAELLALRPEMRAYFIASSSFSRAITPATLRRACVRERRISTPGES